MPQLLLEFRSLDHAQAAARGWDHLESGRCLIETLRKRAVKII